ncbi:carbohydrate deacetylase, partial [Trichloromonas sp.]|uniref:carbohydrate deacetylase n=1 Tax=Trichloromonas sp. TaxID=3069249 RepID=UPI003D816F13
AAAREAKRMELPLGVHLNLSEGRALTGAIGGLTDSVGDFPGKPQLRKILAQGQLDLNGVRRELSAQIDRLCQTGLVPDHLDTHQHFMLFPSVSALVIELARQQGIGALRLPLPAEASQHDPPPPLGDELVLYRSLAPAVAELVAASGLFAPQGLWGMTCLDRLDRQVLVALLEQIPAGTWELMIHPGFVDPDRPFSGVERAREMQALIDASIRRRVADRQIHLTTFGACACAS